MGGGAVLRLDQSKPAARQGLRGDDRFRHRLPLCRLCHAADQTAGSFRMRFESDSEMIDRFQAEYPGVSAQTYRRLYSSAEELVKQENISVLYDSVVFQHIVDSD